MDEFNRLKAGLELIIRHSNKERIVRFLEEAVMSSSAPDTLIDLILGSQVEPKFEVGDLVNVITEKTYLWSIDNNKKIIKGKISKIYYRYLEFSYEVMLEGDLSRIISEAALLRYEEIIII